MNTFINEPDRLESLAGCAFWLVLLAGMMSVLFGTIYRVMR